MKTIDQVIEFIAERIGLIYHHKPLAYGGTAEGVETLLFYYHELWAEIVDRQAELRDTRSRATIVYGGGHSFESAYHEAFPDSTAQECAHFIVKKWRPISDELGLPVPHDRLVKELAQVPGGHAGYNFERGYREFSAARELRGREENRTLRGERPPSQLQRRREGDES